MPQAHLKIQKRQVRHLVNHCCLWIWCRTLCNLCARSFLRQALNLLQALFAVLEEQLICHALCSRVWDVA